MGRKMKNDLEKYLNQRVVIDSVASWIYLGVLEKVTDHCVVLSDVDAHDNTDTATSKELYVFESKTTGIKSNRQTVHINLLHVVSFSLLDDVKEF
jgi:small nuclear ribonucleoprotein (snRNP)-like protein